MSGTTERQKGRNEIPKGYQGKSFKETTTKDQEINGMGKVVEKVGKIPFRKTRYQRGQTC